MKDRTSWEVCGCQTQPTHYVDTMPCPCSTTPPPAPVAEMREPVEVTDEMCRRVATALHRVTLCANAPDMRDVLQLWQRELGPTLGMMSWRGPTGAECRDIENQFTLMNMRLETPTGRDMFDAVRAVMWPKGGES